MAENCERYAVAGRNPEKAEAFRERFGFQKSYGNYEDLLRDEGIEAVYIPLPNSLHLRWVLEALRAGKHVLCEKPLGLNAGEVRKMFRTAEENGVMLMEAYAYLHGPYMKSLVRDVRSGIIGDVDYIETAFITQGYEEDIRLYRELGGGAMYDLGCYCTTMFLSLVDSEPDFVTAVSEKGGKGIDLVTAGLIRFQNGTRASFNVGMMLKGKASGRFDRLYIHGSKGCIRSETEYNQAGNLGYRIITPEGTEFRTAETPQNYSLEIEDFSRNILDGTVPDITPGFSIRNAELIDRILKEISY